MLANLRGALDRLGKLVFTNLIMLELLCPGELNEEP